MVRAVILSILLHSVLIAGLIWSDKLYIDFLKATQKDRQTLSATLLMDKTYKATDTAMKLGSKDRNLPPPKIEIPKHDVPQISRKTSKNLKTKDDGKRKLKDILSKIRKESSEEKRPPPKEKNFPTHEKGEKGAHGTGGYGERIMSLGEQALQSAFRKYFELEGGSIFRKRYPNAKGFISVKLAGAGDQFKIISLAVSDTTGFTILDQSCEVAIRKALEQETFAQDVITDRMGKESIITCTP